MGGIYVIMHKMQHCLYIVPLPSGPVYVFIYMKELRIFHHTGRAGTCRKKLRKPVLAYVS